MEYFEEREDDQPSDSSQGAVKVNATVLEYDGQRMFDAIVRTAAESIVKACGQDIRQAVRESVMSTINDKVGEIIDKSLQDGIQPVNSYGEPTGKSTTLKSLIGKAGDDYLGARVDSEGKANGYRDTSTRLEFIVKKNVEKVIDYQMQTEIKKAVELAVAQAQGKVAEAVAKLIK